MSCKRCGLLTVSDGRPLCYDCMDDALCSTEVGMRQVKGFYTP